MNQRAAEARFFRVALTAPAAEAHQLLRTPGLADALGHFGLEPAPDGLEVPPDGKEFESEFLAAFELGVPHPTVPLVEHHWVKTRPANQILAENNCFYRAFGFTLDRAGELPDHLGPQLSFIEYMLWAIEQRDASGQGADDFRRAVGDFVALHLKTWVPAAAQAGRALRPAFAALLAALRLWVDALAAEYPAQPVGRAETGS